MEIAGQDLRSYALEEKLGTSYNLINILVPVLLTDSITSFEFCGNVRQQITRDNKATKWKRISYNLINILVPVLLTVSNSVEMSSSRLLETIKLRNEKE